MGLFGTIGQFFGFQTAGLDGPAHANLTERDSSVRSDSYSPVTSAEIQRNTTVNAIVALIASVLSQMRWSVHRKNERGAYVEDPDHPFNRILQWPGVSLTGADLRYRMVEDILIHGQVAAVVRRSDDGDPRYIVPLDADNFTIRGERSGFHQFTVKETGEVFRIDEVAYVTDRVGDSVNPASRFERAGSAIRFDNALRDLTDRILKNGVFNNIAVKTDRFMDSGSDEFKALRKAVDEYVGGGGRAGVMGKPMIASGFEVVDVPKTTISDANMDTLLARAKNDICAQVQLPATLINEDNGAKYNDLAQRFHHFARITLARLIQSIEDQLTYKLFYSSEFGPRFPSNFGEFKIVLDQTELTRGDTTTAANVANVLVGGGIWTPNEGRAYMGTGATDAEGADELRHSSSSAGSPEPNPLNMPTPPESDDSPASDEGDGENG